MTIVDEDEKKKRPAPPPESAAVEPPHFQKHWLYQSTLQALRTYISEAVYGSNIDLRLQSTSAALALGMSLLPEVHEMRGQIEGALLQESTPLVPRTSISEDGRVYEVSGALSEKSVSTCLPQDLSETVKRMEYAAKSSRLARLSLFLQALVAELTRAGVLPRDEEF